MRLRFVLAPLRPFRPPGFIGSMLRGAFGHALRDAACGRGHCECRGCDLLLRCAYSAVFEPHRPCAGARGRGPERPPPSFLLEWSPPQPNGQEAFRLDVLLFANAVRTAGSVVGAVGEMCRRGLGPGRVPHRVLSAGAVGPGKQLLPPPGHAEPLRALMRAPGGTPGQLKLRFHTPLRLVEGGRLSREPGYATFVRAAARRLRLLTASLGDSKEGRMPVLDLSSGLEVTVTGRRTTWFHWERRSDRQKRFINMGGIVGEIGFRGRFGPELDFLRAAEVLHLGKGTVLGLGRMEICEGGAP